MEFFKKLPKSKIKITKANGTIFDTFGIITNNIICVEYESITPNNIEKNDIIETLLSNETGSKYKVTNPGFQEKIKKMPAHYQIRYELIDKD